jgi:aminomethyltransferase
MTISADDKAVGAVTSGSHSPMLERGIGMGYVRSELAEPGRELSIDIRGRSRRARLVKKPIYSREGGNGSG